MASLARSVLLVASLACAACGRFDFTEIHAADGGASDSSDALPICLGTGAFTNVHVLANVSSTGMDNGPEISVDGLSLYFETDSSGTANVVVSTRPTRADAFSLPVAIVLPGGDSSDPSVTSDALELYFTSGRGGASCVYRARRDQLTTSFGAPTLLGPLCGTTSAGPAISTDGLVLIYNTTIDPFDEGDLYVSMRASRNDEFALGTKLANLPSNVGYGWLSPDLLRLYFERTSGARLELDSATRSNASADFTNVMPITELDVVGSSDDISLSPDESTVYFGLRGDIWTATRPCL